MNLVVTRDPLRRRAHRSGVCSQTRTDARLRRLDLSVRCRLIDRKLLVRCCRLILHGVVGVDDVLLASERAALLARTRAGTADGEGAHLWTRSETGGAGDVDRHGLRSALLAGQRARRRYSIDTGGGDGRGVRNHLRVGDSRTDRLLGRLAGFGEGIVARVKVLALLELVLEQVLLGKLAVESEELLLFFVQRRDVNLVALGWKHVEKRR